MPPRGNGWMKPKPEFWNPLLGSRGPNQNRGNSVYDAPGQVAGQADKEQTNTNLVLQMCSFLIMVLSPKIFKMFHTTLIQKNLRL